MKQSEGITSVELKIEQVEARADLERLIYELRITQSVQISVNPGTLEADILAIVAGNEDLTLEAVREELRRLFV